MDRRNEKYRQAAIIAQNALKFVITELHRGIGEVSIAELCARGDNYIIDAAKTCFTKVEEKGIARPVEICKNDFSSGVSPEETDKFQGGIIMPEDIVKVTLGVHIDGYTVLAGHTVIVSDTPPNDVQSPYTGPSADAVIGAYLATEAVVGILSATLSENHPLHQEVHGGKIREIVNEIAAAYDLAVVPGSKVRRIKRFVVGQSTVQDGMPVVEWRPQGQPDHAALQAEKEMDAEFVIKPDHTYLIDIQMVSTEGVPGFVKLNETTMIGNVAINPTIYTRNHVVNYSLRTQSARVLLGTVDKALSVFSFKLSEIPGLKINQAKLGLNECLQRHLIVAEPILKTVYCPNSRPKDSKPVSSAREVCTVSLISGVKSTSGYPELVRLSGGKRFPPSWTHSVHSIKPSLAASALESRINGDSSFKYIEVKPSSGRIMPNEPVDDMDLEM